MRFTKDDVYAIIYLYEHYPRKLDPLELYRAYTAFLSSSYNRAEFDLGVCLSMFIEKEKNLNG